MFGHESLPSKVFSYGAQSPSCDEPTHVSDQLYAAHRYQNDLIAIERDRRIAVRALADTASPELARLIASIETMSAEMDAAKAIVGMANSNARSRKGATDEARQRVKDLRAAIREARQKAKLIRSELYANPDFKARARSIDAEAHERLKAARKASMLYHGTYQEAESAAKGSRKAQGLPRFKRWDGDGKIGTQVQGGCSLAEALEGTDSRLRIEILDNRRKPCALVSVRVGSKKGKPIWARSRVRWHREFPRDAMVKWAYILRRRVGLTDHWSILLTVSRAGGFGERDDRAEQGMVHVERRWTKTKDGILVAQWKGDDGRSGELLIPWNRVEMCKSSEAILSIADTRFNDAIEVLRRWVKAEPMPESLAKDAQYLADRMLGESKPSALKALSDRLTATNALMSAWPSAAPVLSKEFSEMIAHSHSWKSSSRLARVAMWMRDNEVDGALRGWLEEWRKHDKHLRNYAAHRRRNFAQWRREHYRLFAVEMRRAYAKCELKKLPVTRLARYPLPEDPNPVLIEARYNQRLASPGFLGAVLKEFGPASGEVASAPVEPLELV